MVEFYQSLGSDVLGSIHSSVMSTNIACLFNQSTMLNNSMYQKMNPWIYVGFVTGLNYRVKKLVLLKFWVEPSSPSLGLLQPYSIDCVVGY